MIQIPNYVLLDLDDTIYATKPCHQAGLKAVEQSLGERMGIAPATVSALYRESRKKVKDRLEKTASSHSRLLYLKTMLETLGLGSQFDLAAQLESAYWGNFIRNMQLAPGAMQLLEACRERAKPVFILTDLTAGIQIRKLVTLGIHNLIQCVVTSEDVGEDKPSLGFLSYLQEQASFPGGHGWLLGDDGKDAAMAALLVDVTFVQVDLQRDPQGTAFTNLAKRLLEEED